MVQIISSFWQSGELFKSVGSLRAGFIILTTFVWCLFQINPVSTHPSVIQPLPSCTLFYCHYLHQFYLRPDVINYEDQNSPIRGTNCLISGRIYRICEALVAYKIVVNHGRRHGLFVWFTPGQFIIIHGIFNIVGKGWKSKIKLGNTAITLWRQCKANLRSFWHVNDGSRPWRRTPLSPIKTEAMRCRCPWIFTS